MIITAAVLALASCTKEAAPEAIAEGDEVTISIACSDAEGTATKSQYPSSLSSRISDVNIFVFDGEGELVSANYYPRNSGISGKELFLQNGHVYDEDFTVYIVSNVGDVHSQSSLKDLDSIESWIYTFDQNYSTFSSKGFPMASVYDAYCPKTDSRTLLADKLVTQYNISFVKSSGNPNKYTIKSGCIHDIANKITPWHEYAAGSTSDITPDGDSFTTSDLSAINAGNAATLYVLENEQGISFPSTVDSDKKKKEENINSSARGKCSYVEFTVKVETPTAVFNDVIYRYYFGDSWRDCSIHRNYLFDLVLNFDNVYVEDEGWRIEPDDPVVDNDAMVLSRDCLSIIRGMSNYFTVTCKDGVEYTLDYSSSDVSRLGINIGTSTSGKTVKYTVSTNYGNYQLSNGTINKTNYEDVPLTFRTKDGLLTKVFTIRVQKNPVVIQFDFDDGVGTADILSGVDWPEGTEFVWSIDGMLYGENVWCNNRLFNRYTCDMWPTSFNQVKDSDTLYEDDAASPTWQTINLGTSGYTGSLQSRMHDIVTSHNTSHTYAVNKEETHYTAVGHAYLNISYGFRIVNGSSKTILSTIPAILYGRQGRVSGPSTTIAVSTGGNISLSCKPGKVPAWPYGSAFNNDDADRGPLGAWTSTSTYYGVSFTKVSKVNGNTGAVTYGFDPDKYYKFTVSGSERSSIYNPSIGITVTHSCPSL